MPWKDNVSYPVAWDPDLWTSPEVEYRRIMAVDDVKSADADIRTERILVNMGPQHPSTHGVFRMVIAIDGENVVGLEPVMGYLHRSHEKIGERNTYLMNIPFTDRLDYLSSMSNNLGYALAVEKLMGVQVAGAGRVHPRDHGRADPDRQPLLAVGFLLNDLGAFFTPALYAHRGARADPRPVRGGRRLPHDVQLHPLRRRGAPTCPTGWVEQARELVCEPPARGDRRARCAI